MPDPHPHPPPPPHLEYVIQEYTPRALTYDSANSGWHATLASTFITHLAPIPPGSVALDLACGTGLVTFRLADAVGPTGRVVGVDITPAMLDVARSRVTGAGAEVVFIEADVASLTGEVTTHPVVRDVVDNRGGFDVISCCSAVVLLGGGSGSDNHHLRAVMEVWASLLRRPGGRLIFDTPTEARTVQLLGTEVLGARVGYRFPFERGWIRGAESLRTLVEGVGLRVEKVVETGSWMPVKELKGRDDEVADEVFETEVLAKYGRGYVQAGLVERARQEWRGLWREEVEKGGGVLRDGHWLYICVGVKV